jgi:hypothetical protein
MPAASERSLTVRELVQQVFEVVGLVVLAAAAAFAAAGELHAAAGCAAGGAALVVESAGLQLLELRGRGTARDEA